MEKFLRSPKDRCGAAVIEMAVVLPILIMLLFGGLELARGVMVKHLLEEASRAGCRTAVVDTTTTAEVEAVVRRSMESAGLSGYTMTVSPNPPTGLEPLEPVTVTVTVPYSEVSWTKLRFMRGKTIKATCIMPAESDGKKGNQGNGN